MVEYKYMHRAARVKVHSFTIYFIWVFTIMDIYEDMFFFFFGEGGGVAVSPPS
jgi:hypothetical protein